MAINGGDDSDSEETMDSASAVAAKRAYHDFMMPLPPHPKRVRTFVGRSPGSVCEKPVSWRPSERLSKVEFTRIPVSRLDLELKYGEELLAETAEFGELRKMYESLEEVALIATSEAEGFLEKVNALEAQVAVAKNDLDDAKKERAYAKKERDGAKKERNRAKKERDDAKKELDDVKKERDDALLESFLGMEREKKILAELDACRLRVAQLEGDRDWIFSSSDDLE